MRTILCVTLRRSGNVKLVEKWTVKFDVGKQKCGHDPQKISRDGEMNAKCSSLFSAVVLGYTFLRLHIHTLQCTCNMPGSVVDTYLASLGSSRGLGELAGGAFQSVATIIGSK